MEAEVDLELTEMDVSIEMMLALLLLMYAGVYIIIWLYQSIARLFVFKKLGVPRWKAFVPFYGSYANFKAVGMSGLWVFAEVPLMVATIPGLKIPVWLTGLAYIIRYGVHFIYGYSFMRAFKKRWWIVPLAALFGGTMNIIAGLSKRFKYDEHYNRYKFRKVDGKYVPLSEVKAAKAKLLERQKAEEKRLAMAEPETTEKNGVLKKITDWIVVHHKIVLIVMLLLTVGSGILAMRVNVNRDLTKYMPTDSETAQGLDIMYNGYEEVLAMPLSVMVKDLSDTEKIAEKEYLTNLDGVTSVSYDSSAEYNKDSQTLYELTVAGKSDGEVATRVYKEITQHFSELGKEIKMRGEVATTNATTLPLWVVGVAVLSALIILIIMAESYVEPILYLVAIGLAVAINMGTNAFLPSVSQITNSITAVLQLALSMDYSIMLATEYHREKAKGKEKITAMKAALSRSFTAISASSVTTIVGMLVLLMMSFTIGRDLGIVLAKGVLLCLVSIFTALPALLLIFDNLVEKTRKKAFSPNLTVLGNLSYKIRKLAIPIFLLIFGGSFVLQMQVGNLYTNTDSAAIDEVFGAYNQMVLMYNVDDEAKISEFCKATERRSDVKRVLCYGNTINDPVEYNGLLAKFASLGNQVDLKEDLVKFLYYHNYDKDETHTLSLAELVPFIKNDLASDATFSGFVSGDVLSQLDRLELFIDDSALWQWRNLYELSEILEVDSASLYDLMVLYDAGRGETGVVMTPRELVDFVRDSVLSNPRYASEIPGEMAEKIELLDSILSLVEEVEKELEIDINIELSASDLIEVINEFGELLEEKPNLSESSIRLLYSLYWHENGGGTWGMSLGGLLNYINWDVRYSQYEDRLSSEQLSKVEAILNIINAKDAALPAAEIRDLLTPLSSAVSREQLELVTILHGSRYAYPEGYTMTVEGVVNYLADTIVPDTRLASVINAEIKDKIVSAQEKIADAKSQLLQGSSGRVVIRAALPAEGEETFKLIRELKEDLAARELSKLVYFVGNSSMAYEMSQSFTRESYIITAVTALVIYIVVAVSFKSWSIPLILVMLIQTAVWITMTITGFTDGSIYFLSLIIVQSLLMGATIDYAIMYTEQYVAARERGLSVAKSVPLAYNKSIQAILTSAGVLTIVTAIVGNFAGNTAGKICKAISDGTFFSTLLILLMLPALMAACDRIVIRQAKKRGEKKN